MTCGATFDGTAAAAEGAFDTDQSSARDPGPCVASATPAPDVARALARSNARVEGRRIRELTVKELQAATRRVRAGGPAGDEGGKEARKVARRVQKSLRAKGAKQAKVRARQVRGRWWLDLELPLESADVLG